MSPVATEKPLDNQVGFPQNVDTDREIKPREGPAGILAPPAGVLSAVSYRLLKLSSGARLLCRGAR